MDAQQHNDAKAQSQHKPSIVRFRLPKRQKSGWLQWLDVLEGMTDQDLLDATQDKTRFRAMYDRFQKLVNPKTKNLYKFTASWILAQKTVFFTFGPDSTCNNEYFSISFADSEPYGSQLSIPLLRLINRHH